MKAMVMEAAGGPEVLALREVETPAIESETGVLVRLRAAGVNPVDTKLRARGTYYPDRAPAILGCDGAGTVEAVGARVDRFRPGDEVYFCSGGIGGPQGNYAEYAVVDQAVVAHKPAALSFAEAAAAPLVFITAWEALYDRARLAKEQRVLIHAGAGGVGHVAIQLAKAVGARVITTVGSEEKAQRAKTLGAEETILYREQDFVEAVLNWSGGDGADVAFDTVGGETFVRSFAAVRPYGDVVSLLQPPADTDWKVARLRNLRTSLELMLSPMYFGWPEALAHQGDILARCAELCDHGALRVHVSETFPLHEAGAAHRRLEQGGMTGKVVLTLD